MMLRLWVSALNNPPEIRVTSSQERITILCGGGAQSYQMTLIHDIWHCQSRRGGLDLSPEEHCQVGGMNVERCLEFVTP